MKPEKHLWTGFFIFQTSTVGLPRIPKGKYSEPSISFQGLYFLLVFAGGNTYILLGTMTYPLLKGTWPWVDGFFRLSRVRGGIFLTWEPQVRSFAKPWSRWVHLRCKFRGKHVDFFEEFLVRMEVVTTILAAKIFSENCNFWRWCPFF